MTETQRKIELSNIGFMKCILMIAVVLCHSLAFWKGTWFTRDPVFSAPILGAISQWLSSFNIFAFVLASGYLYAYVRYERGGYAVFGSFLANKAKRILIPFAFVLVVWVFPLTQAFMNYDFKTVVSRFILCEAPGQLWFLLMLFEVFLLSWPLSNLYRKSTWAGAAVVLGFYALGSAAGILVKNCFQIWTACQYMVFFWLGFMLRTRECAPIRKIHPLIWVFIYTALFAVHYFMPTDRVLLKLSGLAVEFLLHVTGACMAFSVLQWIGSRVKWQDSRDFRFLSERSMPIYLFHQQLIFISIRLLNGRLSPYPHSLINFVFSMALSLAISSLLLAFRPTRFLLGEKPKK